MKLAILTIVYFLLPTATALADPREGLAGTAEAGWMGPLSAVIIIAGAIVIAKKIKQAGKVRGVVAELPENNK